MPCIHRITAALALSSATALAASALTLSDLNMRAGPGTDSPVIIIVPGSSTKAMLAAGARFVSDARSAAERNLFSAVFRQMRARAFP